MNVVATAINLAAEMAATKATAAKKGEGEQRGGDDEHGGGSSD